MRDRDGSHLIVYFQNMEPGFISTFIQKDRPDRIGIFNFERRDERQIFNKAIYNISLIPGAILGEVEAMLYFDVVHGKLGQIPFAVILDLDYQAEIYCDDPETLRIIEKALKGD